MKKRISFNTIMILRVFKSDKWARIYGCRIPIDSIVEVIKFYPRRKVLIKYNGESILTMLWCLRKLE